MGENLVLNKLLDLWKTILLFLYV